MTISQKNFRRKLTGFCILLVFFIFAVACFGVIKAAAGSQQEDSLVTGVETGQSVSGEKATDPGVIKFAFLSAAIAVGVGSLGAGAAVGYVGAAAMGAIGEKPELAGRALIFVGLAEGIAIYGLIIAIMVLGKV